MPSTVFHKLSLMFVPSLLPTRTVIAAALAVHAVRAAARALGQPTVARSELTNWMASSPQHTAFQQRLMERMEPKSFQACITKALVRSGFERGSGSGRFIQWRVPKQLLSGEGSDDGGDAMEEDGDGEDESGGDDGGEQMEDDEPGNNASDSDDEEEADDESGAQDARGVDGINESSTDPNRMEPQEEEEESNDDDNDDNSGGGDQMMDTGAGPALDDAMLRYQYDGQSGF